MAKPIASHTAFVLKRETKTSWRWLEIGTANIDADGKNGAHQVDLDRIPLGGFGGHIKLVPIGTKPPDPQNEPERPGQELQGDLTDA
jgi:hypothetical protein